MGVAEALALSNIHQGWGWGLTCDVRVLDVVKLMTIIPPIGASWPLVNMDVMESLPPVPASKARDTDAHASSSHTRYHALPSGQRGRVAHCLRLPCQGNRPVYPGPVYRSAGWFHT